MAGGQAAVDRTGLWPYASIPYSMSATNTPTGHRADCSGFVSMCWDLPTPGQDTQSFVANGYMVEIPRSELQPGDAIGECGWGSLGAAGHIQLVESYDPWSGLVTYWEQNGGEYGPHRRVNYYINSGYQAYRFTGTVAGSGDDDMTPQEYQDLLTMTRLAEAKAHNASALAFALVAGLDTTDQCVIAYGGSLGQPLGAVDLRPYWSRTDDQPGVVRGTLAPWWDGLVSWPPRRGRPRPRPFPVDEEYANIAYPSRDA